MALNTSGVAKGASDAEKTFRDLENAVDDIGRGGRKVDDLERAIDGVKDETRDAADEMDDYATVLTMGARDGARKLDALERAMRKVQDETKDTAKSTKDLGDDGARGFRKLGDAGEEVSGELRQNLGETFSSFRGDLEDLPQIAQDTLGGLAGSGALGGIPGLAVTAAGAAGLGLIIGAFEKIGEANEREQERIKEWADTFISENGRAISQAAIESNIQDIQNDTEKLSRAQTIAGLSGLELSEVIAGMADPFGEMGRILDEEVNTALDGYKEKSSESKAGIDGINESAAANVTLMESLRSAYEDHRGEVGLGAEAFDVFSDAANRSEVANLRAAAAAGEATVSVDVFGNAIYSLPDGREVTIDAETGVATEDVNALDSKIQGVQGKTVPMRVEVDTSAWDNWTPAQKRGAVMTELSRVRNSEWQ